MIGGGFQVVFGINLDGPDPDELDSEAGAWLSHADGLMYALPGLTGAENYVSPRPLDFQQVTIDGEDYMLAAGDFGGSPFTGPSVPIRSADLSVPPELLAFGAFAGGSGPRTSDIYSVFPVVHDLFVAGDFVYAVGDFDQVLVAPGDVLRQCRGLVRYSFDAAQWEPLEDQALGGVGFAGEAPIGGVIIGGDFTTVGSGLVESYHIGQLNPLAAVGSSENSSASPLAGIALAAPRPNPSLSDTDLVFSIPTHTYVRLTIFDCLDVV